MTENSKYERRGVSSSKSEVHQAIANLDKGLYPTAFCKILPDVVGDDSNYCNIMHADTAGTKTSLAYLYWKETGDYNVWKGIAQDALVMNLDDMACVGCVDNIVLSSTIGRNKHLIDGKVIATIIEGTMEFIENMQQYGINIHHAGGETADVGDIVRSIDVGFTTFARMNRNNLIINDIKDGDVIIGVTSSGQSSYEMEYNSGISSNGLTAARHDVLSKYYSIKYPESYNPNIEKEYVYTGNFKLSDTFENYEIGKLLLSPTRTYLPILAALFASCKDKISGIIHCTGGAQTKVLKFIKNKKIIKNNMLPIPPVFSLIQTTSQTDWREMYQVLNMGHRLEIYVQSKFADQVLT
ncbi:MAG: AIR synthase related protein, partial [Saprospiraceae bacterium]